MRNKIKVLQIPRRYCPACMGELYRMVDEQKPYVIQFRHAQVDPFCVADFSQHVSEFEVELDVEPI